MRLILVGGQIINVEHLVHAEFSEVNGKEWANISMAVPEGDGEGGLFGIRPYRIHLAEGDATAIRLYLTDKANQLNVPLYQEPEECPF